MLRVTEEYLATVVRKLPVPHETVTPFDEPHLLMSLIVAPAADASGPLNATNDVTVASANTNAAVMRVNCRLKLIVMRVPPLLTYPLSIPYEPI